MLWFLDYNVLVWLVCILSYFFWFKNGWSGDNLVTLADLVLRTLGWGVHLCISCCCIVIDVVFYTKHVSLPVHYLVCDVVSVISGLFFCYVGIFKKNENF